MNDTNKLERLQADVLELSRGEREQLLATLAFVDRRAEITLTRDEQFVFDTLATIYEVRIPIQKFLETYGARKFKEKVAEILEFASGTRKFLRPVQINGLITTCLKCLASELRSREIPVTPRTLLDNLGSLPHAVDRRFPGYASAGLLHRVVG